MMPPWRSALLFVAKFALVFGLLTWPWPRVGEVYSLLFCVASTTAVEAFVDSRETIVRFEPNEAGAGSANGLGEWDARFSAVDVRTGGTTRSGIEARLLGYVPFATLLALVLAAPLGWRRRRAIFLGAGALLSARLALAIALPVARVVGAYSAGSVIDSVARLVFWALIEPPDMMYAAPVVAFLVALLATARSSPFPASPASAPAI